MRRIFFIWLAAAIALCVSSRAAAQTTPTFEISGGYYCTNAFRFAVGAVFPLVALASVTRRAEQWLPGATSRGCPWYVQLSSCHEESDLRSMAVRLASCNGSQRMLRHGHRSRHRFTSTGLT
jgi:hypothetical protein